MKKILARVITITSLVSPLMVVVGCSKEDEHVFSYTFNTTVSDLWLSEDIENSPENYPFSSSEQNSMLDNMAKTYEISQDLDGQSYRELLNINESITANDNIEEFFGLEKVISKQENANGYYVLTSFFPDDKWYPFTREGFNQALSNPDLGWGHGWEMSVDPYFNTIFGSRTTDAFNSDPDLYWEYLINNFESINWENVDKTYQILKWTEYGAYVDGIIKLFDENNIEIDLDDKLPNARKEPYTINVKIIVEGNENTGVGPDNGMYAEYLQINGEDFIPEEDGVYLMNQYYGGTLYEDGKEYNGEILETLDHSDWTLPHAIDIGKDDSIIVVYDDDISDGYVPWNFEDTFGFVDTNFFMSDKLIDYNVQTYDNLKFKSDYSDGIITKFTDGELNKYVGASYNTGVATGASLQTLKNVIPLTDYDALLEGLYFVEQPDGAYIDADGYDPDGEHKFIRGQSVNPVPTPLFKSERIAKNAVKITYIQNDDAFKQDYATFGFISEHGTLPQTYEIDGKGVLYIGEETWGKVPLPTYSQGLRNI